MKKTTLALVATLGSTSALAEGKFFAGASLGVTQTDWADMPATAADVASDPDVYVSTDDKDSSFKIYGGYQLNELLSFRAGYISLGEATGTIGEVPSVGSAFIRASNEMEAIFVDVVASYRPIEKLSVFAKLGLAYSKSTFEVVFGDNSGSATLASSSDKSLAVAPGLGVNYDITPAIGLTAEYEFYTGVGKKHGTNETNTLDEAPKADVGVLSVGAFYRF